MTLALLMVALFYVDPLGTCWNATGYVYDKGPGDIPYVWISINADPRRLFHVPVDTTSTGLTFCKKAVL